MCECVHASVAHIYACGGPESVLGIPLPHSLKQGLSVSPESMLGIFVGHYSSSFIEAGSQSAPQSTDEASLAYQRALGMPSPP